MKKISSKLHQKALIIMVIFASIAVLKVEPTVSSFNPCPSLLSVATEERKQFQCLNMVLRIKTRTLVLEFSSG